MPVPCLRLRRIVQDITERKAAELHLLGLNDRLEQQVAERTSELEQSLRELETFTHSAAHDLRAPIRAIAGMSTVMVEDFAEDLGAPGIKLLKTMETSAHRMGELIDPLLEMSRLSRLLRSGMPSAASGKVWTVGLSRAMKNAP